MSVWQWIAIILVCCSAVALATGLIMKDITLRLNFNEMMTKMADGINAFTKTLRGDDADANE